MYHFCVNRYMTSVFVLRQCRSKIKQISVLPKFCQKATNNDFLNEIEAVDEEYESIANKCFLHKEQNCFIIHPYIKWGPKKKTETSKENELSEAVSLINTLAGWKISDKLIIPVENLDKKTIFGSGTLEKLKQKIRQQRDTSAVFINIGTLKNSQINELEFVFGVRILDRYKIVMQILRQHAITKHAKLQVALAEIPYLRSRLKYIDIGSSDNWKVKDRMLQERERKLKTALGKLRNQRELLRNKRTSLDFPIVAVVGYTNVGKTSLIKCLTGDKTLEPRNQLFATLDVTMHAGYLPSKLKVLYVDTIGFITDIPTDLIECFIATLEDAMLANVILHVQDVSNENMKYQAKHVDSILETLTKKIGNEHLKERIIYVGNKADSLIETNLSNQEIILVSAKNLTGFDVLRQKIESVVLKTTGREKISIRVPTGGDEMRWIYKNATVVEQMGDVDDCQFQIVNCVITQSKLKQFYLHFVAQK